VSAGVVAADAADALNTQVKRGLAWKAVSTVALQGLRLVTAITLAHLLTPHQYGVAGMVLVFASLILVFSDLAFGSALIHREQLSEADRSTVFWTSTGVGLLLTLVGVAMSWPLAAFYNEPAVQPLCAALSLGFVVTAATSTQTALLMRDMNFRTLELRQIASAAVGAVVGITLAARGAGAWAIIAQQLAIAVVSSLMLWVWTPWRPKFTFSMASLRSMAGYSGNILGSRLLFYVNRNIDNILVGRFLGPAALGAYQVGYNLMLAPLNQLASPAQEVLFPALARVQDDPERLGAAWVRAVRLIGAVAVPALAGLAVTAPDFVRGLLGERWAPAIPIIQVLCWVGLLQSLQGFNSAVLRAVDATRVLLRYSVIVSVASTIAFVAGLPFGVVGVAAAYAISSTLVEPYYAVLTARAANVPLRRLLGALSGVAAAAVLMASAVLTLRLGLTHAGVTPLPRFGAEIVLGALLYVPLCHLLAPEVTREARRLWSPRRAA
jgi:O-antigen/teichoic acid export membrane protein